MRNIVKYSEFVNENWFRKDVLSNAVDELIKRLEKDVTENPFRFYKHKRRRILGIFYSTILHDRAELTKKILDALPDVRAKEMVNTVYDNKGYPAHDNRSKLQDGYKHALDLAKSDEMRMLLIEYIPKEEIKKMFTKGDSFDVMKTINQ